jgi:alpha-N-arabinofuranosidase
MPAVSPAELGKTSTSVTPTRALFRYRRDDRAPGHLTTVRINAARAAAAPVSPLIFGNFIEHLGGVVYDGIWAQALLNPNLERIAPNDKTPPDWERTGPTAWQAGGYLSPLCVRLAIGSALEQTVPLPSHRTRNYTGYLYARAPEGKGEITVALQGIGPKAGRVFAQAALPVENATWRKFAVSLVLPEGALAKGERARFVVMHAGGGPVDIDQCELFPKDNLLGMDPDVIKKAREWHIPALRYPGGNFASGYHWQDGIFRREQRPTRRNPAWGGVEPNHFGTNEFIRFCRLIGAQPQITVNAGDGTPEEAAAWVEYCNAPPGRSKYGLMRATNSSPEEYEVGLWEIGNELYGGWQIGHTDAAGNAARFVRFRDAMLQADPDIHLIATGKGDEFTPEGLQRNRIWNERLLRAALANGRPAPDYLSLHPLVPLPYDLEKATYAEQYESAMAQPTFLSDRMLPDLAALITAIEGPHAKTRLAVTEWGLIVGGPKWRDSPNHDTQAGAVFNALTLNAFLRNSDWVTLANMTALLHGGGIKKVNGVVIVDPQFWTQKLYTDSRPHTPVATTTTGPGRDVPARGFLPAVVNVPDVDVAAALTADARTLVVYAVNRHRTEARPLRLEVAGFAAASLSATLLTASDPQARNTLDKPDNVAPRPFPTPAWPAANGDWRVSLPPHSLALFTLSAKR